MSNTAAPSSAPLARDRAGAPFAIPADAVAWRVYAIVADGRRPAVLWTDRGIMYLGLDATMDHLRDAVAGRPGRYALVPVDRCGSQLAPAAVAEIAR